MSAVEVSVGITWSMASGSVQIQRPRYIELLQHTLICTERPGRACVQSCEFRHIRTIMHALKKNNKKKKKQQHLFGKSLAESFREKGYFCVYVLLLKASDLSDVETKKERKVSSEKCLRTLKVK